MKFDLPNKTIDFDGSELNLNVFNDKNVVLYAKALIDDTTPIPTDGMYLLTDFTNTLIETEFQNKNYLGVLVHQASSTDPVTGVVTKTIKNIKGLKVNELFSLKDRDVSHLELNAKQETIVVEERATLVTIKYELFATNTDPDSSTIALKANQLYYNYKSKESFRYMGTDANNLTTWLGSLGTVVADKFKINLTTTKFGIDGYIYPFADFRFNEVTDKNNKAIKKFKVINLEEDFRIMTSNVEPDVKFNIGFFEKYEYDKTYSFLVKAYFGYELFEFPNKEKYKGNIYSRSEEISFKLHKSTDSTRITEKTKTSVNSWNITEVSNTSLTSVTASNLIYDVDNKDWYSIGGVASSASTEIRNITSDANSVLSTSVAKTETLPVAVNLCQGVIIGDDIYFGLSDNNASSSAIKQFEFPLKYPLDLDGTLSNTSTIIKDIYKGKIDKVNKTIINVALEITVTAFVKPRMFLYNNFLVFIDSNADTILKIDETTGSLVLHKTNTLRTISRQADTFPIKYNHKLGGRIITSTDTIPTDLNSDCRFLYKNKIVRLGGYNSKNEYLYKAFISELNNDGTNEPYKTFNFDEDIKIEGGTVLVFNDNIYIVNAKNKDGDNKSIFEVRLTDVGISILEHKNKINLDNDIEVSCAYENNKLLIVGKYNSLDVNYVIDI